MERHIRSTKNSFSLRNQLVAPKEIQLNNFDRSTRRVLNAKCWEILYVYAEQKIGEKRYSVFSDKIESEIKIFLLENVLDYQIGGPTKFDDIKKAFDFDFCEENASPILDAIELISNNLKIKGRDIYKEYNELFEQFFVGYRFINGLICPISNDFEKSVIEQAFSTKYQKVNYHIIKALELLSDRENPDYHNSIKESHTALESFGLIEGNGGIYRNFRELIKPNKNINNKLFDSIEKLIEFANEEPGIRHDNKNETHDISFEEAKFCLVIASGVINYLINFIKDNVTN